jgi:O-methyltransferase
MKLLRYLSQKLLRGRLQQKISYTFEYDGLATIHNSDFMNDQKFRKAYKLAEETGSWYGHQMPWRAYIAFWLAEQAKRLEGDFVECGVNRGGLALGIIDYINFQDTAKKFYLFDTFEGFDNRYISQQEVKQGILNIYKYGDCYEQVKATFRNFNNVEIVKGSVPDTLTKVEIKNVAFLSIDMNCAFPEIEALNFFWDKLTKGAIIILDDYGFEAHIAQKKAHDEFARQKGISVLSLPTGQGLIIKTY